MLCLTVTTIIIVSVVVIVVCLVKPCRSNERVIEYTPGKIFYASDQTGMKIPHAFGQTGIKEGETNHYESIEEINSYSGSNSWFSAKY